jgi:hypothetical protein
MKSAVAIRYVISMMMSADGNEVMVSGYGSP